MNGLFARHDETTRISCRKDSQKHGSVSRRPIRREESFLHENPCRFIGAAQGKNTPAIKRKLSQV